MADKTDYFLARDMSIQNLLFSPDTYFSIPVYQRPYTWTIEEATDFWNDLLENNDGKPYYFGSFMFHKIDWEDVYEIIDWQQRTLTISIFIMVIRDLLQWDDLKAYEQANEIQRDYIAKTTTLWPSKVKKYRVTPWYSTKDYFRRLQDENKIRWEKTPKKKEEKEIYKVYNFFYDKFLEELENQEDKIGYLINIFKKLINSSCIRILVSDETMAFTIFETVNDRWAKLSAWDLVKNLFFKFFHENWDPDWAIALWDQLETNINASGWDISWFLRNYWKAKYRYISNNDVFKAIKWLVKNTNYETILREIVDCSEFYKVIWKPKDNYLSETKIYVRYQSPNQSSDLKKIEIIQNNLQLINLLWVKIFYPVFISIFANYKTLVENDVIPVELVENIEKFCYSFYKICWLAWREIEQEVCDYAIKNREICNSQRSSIKTELEENNRQFTDILKEKMPKFWVFSEKFRDVEYKPNSPVIKYSLKMISNMKQVEVKNEDIFDYSTLSIEHLLPQDPTQWGLSVDDVKEYVNLMWNLTLVWKNMNSALSNDPLEEKINGENWLLSCDIIITKELVNNIINDWYVRNREKIEKRTDELCETLFNMHILK